jgi:hypothetical protein
MRIGPIALSLCLGLGVMPGLSHTANAGYDVTVLHDAGVRATAHPTPSAPPDRALEIPLPRPAATRCCGRRRGRRRCFRTWAARATASPPP